MRGSIEGGIGIAAGHAFLSRPIVDSFAIVSTGGHEGLTVMQENQVVGKTDASGHLVLTPLRPYQPNLVSIDPLSAPIGIGIGKPTHKVVPMWRSGVVLDFDVRRGRSALVRLQLADGTPLPSSARVVEGASGESLPVGLDGEVFITGLADTGTRLAIEWADVRCDVDVTPEGDDPVLELGPYRCEVPRR